MRKNLPRKEYFIDKKVPGLQGYIISEFVNSGCNAHVFRAHNESINSNYACKIIPKSNLKQSALDSRAWIEEPLKANSLTHPSVVKCSNVLEWIDAESEIDCVVLCYDFIRGVSLRDYVKNHKNNITISFIESYLKTILELMLEMQLKLIEHGDLHSGNVIVEDPTEYQIRPHHKFRITDFGVGFTTSDQNFKDDFEQVAATLKELITNVKYQALGARDRFAFNVLNDHFLARHLVENDTTRDINARNPRRLYELIENINLQFDTIEADSHRFELTSPFDYLSCEQLGESHSLLKALYSNLFLGIRDIEAKSNLVLTGPRGCGKSTVFKSLSLKHRHYVNDDDPTNISYIGIYYRCDDLYFSFPRYVLPEQDYAIDISMHYLTSSLIVEVLETLQLWGGKYFKSELDTEESRISFEVWKILDIEKPKVPAADTFSAITERLQKERDRAATKQRFVNDPKQNFGKYFGPDILVKVCEAISEKSSYLRGRPFFFFIDDYSYPKIRMDLQKNLNRLLMQRTSAAFFKLSTESPVSYARCDIDGKVYVEGREFSLLNLGLVYLSNDNNTNIKLDFINDVFSRRFNAISDYPVKNLEELIGSNPNENHNEVARAIRGNQKPELWGKEVLANLCSGDIHYIISLVGKMVTAVGGKDSLENINAIPKIGSKIQNKSIKDEAGNFLKSLKGIGPNGEQLVKVVNTFGIVANSYLKYRNSKNEEDSPPWQASRIEPYEELELTGQALSVYEELLRYSVFLEDPRGKSRRGKVVPRIFLRRFLVPYFNLTFNKRDSVPLEKHEIELLLTDPDAFEKRKRLKSFKDIDDDNQGDLFSASGSGVTE